MDELEELENKIETVPFIMSLPMGVFDKSECSQLHIQHSIQPLWFSLVAFVAEQKQREQVEIQSTTTPLGMLIEKMYSALDQPYLDSSVLESERLEAAIVSFCNDATESDWHARLRWLSALQHAMEMEQSSDHVLMNQMLRGCIDIANFMFQCRFNSDSSLKQISKAITQLRAGMNLTKYSVPICCAPKHPLLNRTDKTRLSVLHSAVRIMVLRELLSHIVVTITRSNTGTFVVS